VNFVAFNAGANSGLSLRQGRRHQQQGLAVRAGQALERLDDLAPASDGDAGAWPVN
jgi:hypothetical protein